MASREDSYKAGRHEECKSAGRHQECKSAPRAEVSGNASRDGSARQAPRKEGRQFNRSHEEPPRKEEFTLNRDDEQRRRTIVEALQKGQPYKNFARRVLDHKGQYSKQEVNSVIKHVYGIDNNHPGFVFEEKMPRRMHDSNKWKRTDVGLLVDGRLYSYQATEPKMIRHRAQYSNENRQQVITSNPGDTDKQLIGRPSKEKYGYLPQFHEELDSPMPGSFGNSEKIEDFLVGGKAKLQDIRGDLDSHFSGIHANDIDGQVLSSNHNSLCERKKLTLWGVDIYKEDFVDGPEDVESSQRNTGSEDQQYVNHSNKI